MSSSRLPRFKRVSTVSAIQVTDRDLDICRLLHRHRFLRAHDIILLLGGSTQPIQRRLQLLYHHGYVERPRAQLEYYNRPGSRSIVYGLGNKGGKLIKRELGLVSRSISWGEKNRAVRRIFLEHALWVSSIMVELELAYRRSDHVRLLYEDELQLSEKRQPFQWKAKLSGGLKLGIVPDRVFALETVNQDKIRRRTYFFLEADRGTMPVERRHLRQTSLFRKLLAYEATWKQRVPQNRFGFNRFKVIFVTTSPARLESLLAAAAKLKRGQGLFLFADQSILGKDLFALIWRTTEPHKAGSLLN